MVRVYLIRHGKTDANEKHILSEDYPLSASGCKQVENFGRMFRALGVNEVYASALLCARETALYLSSVPLTKDHQLPEFNEINFGDAENKHYGHGEVEGFENNFKENLCAFLREAHGDNPHKRAKGALEKIQDMVNLEIKKHKNSTGKNKEKCIAIITSDMLLRCIMNTLLNGDDWNNTGNLRFKHLSGISLEYDDDGKLEKYGYI